MIDKRPAVIIRAAGVADVRRAVSFARERDLPISIKGGGHNVAGQAVSDGGMMVDLGAMRAVWVDPWRGPPAVQGAHSGPTSTARRDPSGWPRPVG